MLGRDRRHEGRLRLVGRDDLRVPSQPAGIRGGPPAGSPSIAVWDLEKGVAEDYLRFYRRTRRLDFTALALGNVYGPRQDPAGEAGVTSIFGAKLLSGEAPTIFCDGRQTRDYVYVNDVAAAFLAAIDAGSGLLLNVGSSGRRV